MMYKMMQETATQQPSQYKTANKHFKQVQESNYLIIIIILYNNIIFALCLKDTHSWIFLSLIALL